MPFPIFVGGQRVTAALLASMNSGKLTSTPLGVIARYTRTSNTGALSGESGVIRIDGIPTYSGRYYAFSVPRLRIDNVTSADRGIGRIRYTTTGVAATTGSTSMGKVECTDADSYNLTTYYAPSADAMVSALFTANRIGGSSNFTVTGADEGNLEMIVTDLGLAPTPNGFTI